MVGTGGIFDGDLAQCSVLWVEGGLPKLFRIHLTETLVALDVDAAVAAALAAELCDQAVALVVVPRVNRT